MMNRNIVSKLIKNVIFKKVLHYIGPKYTEDYLLDYEDIIIPNPEKDIFICYNKDGKGIVLNSSNFSKYQIKIFF